MEKIVNPDDIKQFIKSRDDFLKTVSKVYCKNCHAPRKKKMNINYENPFKCECHCDKVEKLLAISSELELTIKSLTNQ